MNKKMISHRLILILFLIVSLFPIHGVNAQDWIYTTVKGDSLWNLSEKHLDKVTRYSQLKKINGIAKPKRMQPGTLIRIPMKWIRTNSVPAQIMSLHGKAELFRADDRARLQVASGMLIYLGDRLKSGKDSSVAVKFADGSILTLHSDSVIRFDHLSAHGKTGMVDSRLHLLKGRMDTRVKPSQGPGSRFEIQTPSAVSAVRGTEYRALVASDSDSSNIEVLKGKVVVSGAQNKKLIKAGYGTQVKKGKAPLLPRKLLAPPRLESKVLSFRSMHSIIAWEPIKGASKYRIELASDQSFNTLLWQQFKKSPQVAFPDLADGHYAIRIRAIDKQGLEGKSSVGTIVLDARPQAPIPLKPVEAFVLRGKAPELQWTSAADANNYRLEIAADKEFKQRLLTREGLSKTHFTASDLTQSRRYYWRLSSISADGEVGPAGIIRSYEIRPVPAIVEADLLATDDGKLHASWLSGAKDQLFQVQLAYDENFNDLELDMQTSIPSLDFDAVTGQVRYLRIRVIESDGYQGPWGSIQRIDPVVDETIWLVPVLGFLGFILL